ncbi:olfactory receptor 14A16-like [Tachyglossus aculeatus]|uniref:olfactory receptor 14A16-like n=1 Tax=Tachyglossus aculeatus TaxID=9261 RepID=UPI0018F5EE61|nr:olfactory receptor 14A16-like [Tachyglossus aculeatus]
MVTEFLQHDFSELREVQLFHAALFLLVYLAAPTGNLIIASITALDWNLAIHDLYLITVTVPNSVLNFLTNRNSIFSGCAAQVFLVVLFGGSEFFILSAMSCYRYVAICHPLYYGVIMDQGASIKMAATSWLSGGLCGILFSSPTSSPSFCGPNVFQELFCDVPSLLKISCSEDRAAIDVCVTSRVVFTFICFVSIVILDFFIYGDGARLDSRSASIGERRVAEGS